MSKVSSASKIKVKSFDDLFSGANAEQNVPEQEIKRIPINLLHDFQHHPFKIKEDDRFYEMVDSIKKYGVLVPGLARPRAEGGYEIVAGHTRRMACLHAGVDDMPFIVKNYNDDEATIVMVDSNIQREDILVSEKARAYKMRYDAVKHQGKKGNTLNAMSEDTGENAKKIQRYIWLARLNDELLEMVDVKALGFSQGVAISFLNEDEQSWVLGAIRDLKINVSTEQSEELKGLSQSHKLDEAGVWRILSPRTVAEIKKRKVTMKSDLLDDYFSEEYTEEQIKDIIVELLDNWKRREG